MSCKFQIVEKDGMAVDWAMPRPDYTTVHFTDKDEAIKNARRYVTERNFDNALAAAEKETSAEMFMMDDQGVYLGELDGKSYYMRYKKNELDRKDRTKVLHKTGDVVQDKTYFELENKGEVVVREVPGT